MITHPFVVIFDWHHARASLSVWLLVASGLIGAAITSENVTLYFLKVKKKTRNAK